MTVLTILARDGVDQYGTAEDHALIRHWPLALAYLVIGLALYGRILNTFFVADDFTYLDFISKAPSPAVVFSVLAERYFRPLVVLVYYVNYHISGLSSWTYHLSVLLVHIANAWLVFLLGRRLAPERTPLVPALAGLLFLAFGGHAEAVTWIGGMADPLVTFFLFLALLFLSRALESPRPLPSMVATWLSFAMALLSKESAAAFLGFAAIFALLGASGLPGRTRIRRSVIVIAGAIVMLAVYFLVRKMVLGFAFVNLQGMHTSTNLLPTLRAFVLRSFVPYNPWLSRVWNGSLDVYVIGPIVIALLFFVRREGWRPLTLLTMCFGVAIAPVLPLNIAIATPESERFIYLPSAFALLLLVWFLGSTFRRSWLITAIVLVYSVGNAWALDRINRRWETAAMITRGITSSFGEIVREHGQSGRPVFVLNVPDNVRGAFVYRRGFHDSLRLTAPAEAAKISRTEVLSVYSVIDASKPATVSQRDSNAFDVILGGGELIGTAATSPLYTISDSSARGFSATFSDVAGPALVVYFTPQQTRSGGELPRSGLPFQTLGDRSSVRQLVSSAPRSGYQHGKR